MMHCYALLCIFCCVRVSCAPPGHDIYIYIYIYTYMIYIYIYIHAYMHIYIYT